MGDGQGMRHWLLANLASTLLAVLVMVLTVYLTLR